MRRLHGVVLAALAGIILNISAAPKYYCEDHNSDNSEYKRSAQIQGVTYSKRKNREHTYFMCTRVTVPVEERIKAIDLVSNVQVLLDNAIYKIVDIRPSYSLGVEDGCTVKFDLRGENDPIRKHIIEILGTLPIDVLFKGGYPKFHGDLRSITYRSCSENPNVYFEPSDNADFVSCYFTHAYYLLCKAFAKDPSKVSEFMIRTDKSIHSLFFNNGKLFTNTKGLSEEQFVGFLSGASSKGLMDVFKMNYGEKEMSSERRFSLASEFTKGVYKLMDDKTKRAVAKYIAEYEVGDDRDGCDYGFEKSVLSENREYLRSIWGFEEYAYPRKSILAKLSSSLYSKDEIMALRQKIIAMRGAFDGIFGVKFGTSVDVSKCENVSAFGFDFYRVPFIPEKKSKAFEYYDLWVTKITHKVFAIQGRSKSGITYGDTKVGERNVPPLVAALEKKYQNMSTDIGPGWKMEFPSEKCTLTVIGDVKGCANRTVSVSSVLAADVAGGIFGSSFGNAVLSNTFAENDKIRRSVKDYLMSEQDKKIGCTVVGESLELVALAAKESKIAVREKAREEALRKKIEADSAADAF